MIYQIAADLIVVLHFVFLLFVVLGGLFVLRWRRLAWVHLPAVVWGVLIELFNWACPLTWLEMVFRRLSGGSGYSGGFIDHYLLQVVYPERSHHFPIEYLRIIQAGAGIVILLLNLGIYGYFFFREVRKERSPS